MITAADKLRLWADDPMWADHAEVPKEYLHRIADELDRLTRSRDGYAKDAAVRATECDLYLKRVADLEAHKRAQAEDIMRLGAMVGRMLHIADTNGFGDAAREVISPKPPVSEASK